MKQRIDVEFEFFLERKISNCHIFRMRDKKSFARSFKVLNVSQVYVSNFIQKVAV